MKDILKSLVVTIVIMAPFLIPTSDVVEIERDNITSIKPFAGTINGNLVGTTLCCKYAFNYDEDLPEVATYHIIKPLLLQYLGFTYTETMIIWTVE
jgi:hypothetical protein